MNKIQSLALSSALLLLFAGGAAAGTTTRQDSSSGIIALDSLPNPPTTLATATVVDVKGTLIGAVQKVVMDTSGKPASVDVALLGTGAVVALNADAFNYDQGNNVLMAHLDAQQIAEQPRAPG